MSSRSLPDTNQILSALAGSSRGPLKPKDLANVLKLPKSEYREFKDLLRTLERKGKLYRVKGNRYAAPEKISLVVGVLQFTRNGDAFLRPVSSGQEDVFVPERNQGSAMDGDQVAVRIESRPRGRARVGSVVKVLERARPTVVGTYHANRGFGFVKPSDRKVFRDLLIPEGKSAGALDGEVVVVRITQFGDRRKNGVGEIEEVLGPIDDPGVDVLSILHGHGLSAAFSESVEEAAATAEARMSQPGDRVDRRELLTFTIDPSDAKDHDDALSVTVHQDGVWEVGVHIADVSHFVEEGSALDLEALRRGTSVYLVDQVVPMLPHRLSSNLCSLKEGEDRLAVSLFMVLDGTGRLRSHRFERTWIRCEHGLDYDRVQAILNGTATTTPEIDDALKTLDRLAKAIRGRRIERGSLDFDLPEARVILDEDGVPIDIRRTEQLDSHRLIEDFMILANEVVATEAAKRRLPVPYRIHEPPPEDRFEELREFMASVGHSLSKGKPGPQVLQNVLNRIEGRPEAALISTVILRSMQRARYAPENVGHFGLASKAYTHFTSPIRRYPDLVLHRVIKRCLVDGAPPHERWDGPYLEEVTTRSSERERVAQQAERSSVDMKKIEFMIRHLGDDFSGTISGVTSFGFFVLLDRYFVEGLIHVSSLGDDYYVFQPDSYVLVGERSKRRFQLGERVQVQVVRADKEERQIDFLLLKKLTHDRFHD